MWNPPIGEKGIWFYPITLYYIYNNHQIWSEYMWRFILQERKNKLLEYNIDELLHICAPSHKMSVLKHKCIIELVDTFNHKQKVKDIYEVMKLVKRSILTEDIGIYICKNFL
jgi:hypothetical protein